MYGKSTLRRFRSPWKTVPNDSPWASLQPDLNCALCNTSLRVLAMYTSYRVDPLCMTLHTDMYKQLHSPINEHGGPTLPSWSHPCTTSPASDSPSSECSRPGHCRRPGIHAQRPTVTFELRQREPGGPKRNVASSPRGRLHVLDASPAGPVRCVHKGDAAQGGTLPSGLCWCVPYLQLHGTMLRINSSESTTQ